MGHFKEQAIAEMNELGAGPQTWGDNAAKPVAFSPVLTPTEDGRRQIEGRIERFTSNGSPTGPVDSLRVVVLLPFATLEERNRAVATMQQMSEMMDVPA